VAVVTGMPFVLVFVDIGSLPVDAVWVEDGDNDVNIAW
jgi:hypothetical protein